MGNILLLRSATSPLGNIIISGALTGLALGQGAGFGSLINPAQFAPNLPTGYTKIWDRQWDPTDPTIPGGVLPPASLTGTDSTGMAWGPGDGTSHAPLIGTVASINTATGLSIPSPPDGHANIMAVVYPSGYPDTNLPFDVFPTGSVSWAKMHGAFWVYMPSSFNSNGNNIKWLGIGGNSNYNHICMLSSLGTTDYRAAWLVLQGNVNESLGGQNSLTNAVVQVSPPNPPPQGTGIGWWPSMFNQWLCIEWHVENDTNGSNGIFESWITVPGQASVLVNQWTNLGFQAPAFQAASFIPYYGGGGSAAPSAQYIIVARSAAYGSN